MDDMKALFKTMMKQQNSHMSDEEISNMMATALGSSNSTTASPATPHSSASTHILHCEEEFKSQIIKSISITNAFTKSYVTKNSK
ncbi:hypothetical protein RYX36_031638 [Vicia faba]